jgi:hypothetical protein
VLFEGLDVKKPLVRPLIGSFVRRVEFDARVMVERAELSVQSEIFVCKVECNFLLTGDQVLSHELSLGFCLLSGVGLEIFVRTQHDGHIILGFLLCFSLLLHAFLAFSNRLQNRVNESLQQQIILKTVKKESNFLFI